MRFDLDLPPGGEERIGIQTRRASACPSAAWSWLPSSGAVNSASLT